MSYTRESGLEVTDQRHYRGGDPRTWPANENVQPPPPVGAGPTTSEGVGNTHAMYPATMAAPPVQAWSGWPVEWDTPNWGDAAGGLAAMINRVSVVWGAIDLNASILSTMPPYRVAGRTVVASLPWMSNPQPEVYTDWTEAAKQLVISYMNGEVFVWATSRYSDGTVRTWVVLNPAWVKVEMHGQVRTYEMGGLDVTSDVLHIRYSSWPGDARGHGPLEALSSNLFGAAALEKYQAGLAVRGGVPWGVLTAPGNLSSEQAYALRDNFVAARLSAMGAPAVMSGGVTLAPFTIGPREMALLELRQFDEARISTLMRCPPTLLGLPTGEGSLVYSNVTAIYDFHWRAHLRPIAAALTGAISQWALPGPQAIELNRDEYVRPSFAERVAGYATLFNIHDELTGERGITIEEIRAAERLTGLTPELTAVTAR
jgi:hypothetical protein